MSAPSTTRRVVANISLSLDGRIHGSGGEYDMGWIVPHAVTEVARDHMVAVTKPATTALLGRKNYEGFGGYWPSVAEDESAAPQDRTFSAWLNDVDKVVFTHSPGDSEWQHTTLTDRSPADVVTSLRAEDGGDIIVLSSSSIIRQLLEADEVDRLCITSCPAIVGGGEALFTTGLPASDWTLVTSTPTGSGAAVLVYDRAR